jgi:membrane-bound serine protease (ClpP class)
MIHHPIILGSKVVLLLILAIILVILHAILPPEQFQVALKIAIGVFVVGIFAIWIVFFMMLNNPNSKLSKSIVLTATSKENDEEKAKENEKLASLIGTVGTAETNLRPSGVGCFNGDMIDVVSDRMFIEKGEQITVVGAEGKKIKVKKLTT